jgi:hypothetical protein
VAKIRGLVLDYISRGESPAEGKIIQNTWRNMGWEAKLVSKPGKGETLQHIYGGYKYDILHITAHANPNSLSSTRKGKGSISIGEIRKYFLDRLTYDSIMLDDTVLVVNSGCNTASEEWYDLFLNTLRVRNYVGCEDEPSLAEGIIFPLAIYFQFWGSKRMLVKKAFEVAEGSVSTSAKWKFMSRHS